MEIPPGGVEMTDEEIATRWDPWSPVEVAARLAALTVPWGVAAGWAIELFVGRPTRPHEDLEITVPAGAFPAIMGALEGYEWDVAGAHRRWPYPAAADVMHQTWVRDRSSDRYHLDVFREPHDGDTWIYRRHPDIRLPYAEVYARTAAGVPFVVPEVVLLFKATARREKDEADFESVLPHLDAPRRARLRAWLAAAHAGHAWIDRLG